MKLDKSLNHFRGFLVDASGVIYERGHFFEAAIKAFSTFQTLGSTFLATNNSYMYVHDIVTLFKKKSPINLTPTQIISSGHGLTYDPKILSKIEGSRIFFFGQSSSQDYLKGAPPHQITERVKDANLIILASYTQSSQDYLIEEIIDHAKQHPDVNIICCNWDRFVRSGNTLLPVIGSVAQRIEDSIQRPIYWFGKPMENYSKLVKQRLQEAGLTVNSDIIFFDDNIQNVVSMEKHIGISGCWVKSTGIYFKHDTSSLFKEFGKPTFMIEAFDLDAELIHCS